MPVLADDDARTVAELPIEERLLLDEFRRWALMKRSGRGLSVDLRVALGEGAPAVHGGAHEGSTR